MDITTSQSVADREEEGTVVKLTDATGEKLYEGEGAAKRPVTITVVGTYSRTYREAMSTQRDKNIKARRGSLTGEQLEQQQVDVIAACILAWDGFTANGQPVPLNKTNAAALLESAPWIREQVEAAMQDHASFFAAS